MGEKKEISVNIFMPMFTAISYLQEQRIFNVEDLKNYLWKNYYAEEDVIDQIDVFTQLMADTNMILRTPKFKNIYRISNDIDYKDIIENNHEYLDDMVQFFYSYYNDSKANIKVVENRMKKKK